MCSQYVRVFLSVLQYLHLLTANNYISEMEYNIYVPMYYSSLFKWAYNPAGIAVYYKNMYIVYSCCHVSYNLESTFVLNKEQCLWAAATSQCQYSWEIHDGQKNSKINYSSPWLLWSSKTNGLYSGTRVLTTADTNPFFLWVCQCYSSFPSAANIQRVPGM